MSYELWHASRHFSHDIEMYRISYFRNWNKEPYTSYMYNFLIVHDFSVSVFNQ
jgi:hypothetical protein